MNYLYLSISLLLINCTNQSTNLNGDWIAKYTLNSKSNDIFVDYEKKIYSFHKDSIQIQNYLFEYNFMDNKILKSKFEIHDNQLIYNIYEDSTKVKIDYLRTDSLVFEYNETKLVLEKLVEFNQLKFRKKLDSLLLEYNWKLDNSDIHLEFLDGGGYISNTLLDFTSNWGYNIDSFQHEVFLIFSGTTGPMLQLKELKMDSIKFIFYHQQTKEIKFTKNKKIPHYSKSDLIGVWKKQSWIIEKDTFFQKELDSMYDMPNLSNLLISDSLISKRWDKEISNQRSWILSKSGDIIIFNQPWETEGKFQWNIINLTKDELVIENRRSSFGPPIEQIAYKKLR